MSDQFGSDLFEKSKSPKCQCDGCRQYAGQKKLTTMSAEDVVKVAAELKAKGEKGITFAISEEEIARLEAKGREATDRANKNASEKVDAFERFAVEAGAILPGSLMGTAAAEADKQILGARYNQDPEQGGIKFDGDKVRVELVPFDAVQEIAKILTLGARKYADDNWANGMSWRRVLGSCLRHLFAYSVGEDRDPETGELHLAHAGCNVLFLLTYQLRLLGEDDRLVLGENFKGDPA